MSPCSSRHARVQWRSIWQEGAGRGTSRNRPVIRGIRISDRVTEHNLKDVTIRAARLSAVDRPRYVLPGALKLQHEGAIASECVYRRIINLQWYTSSKGACLSRRSSHGGISAQDSALFSAAAVPPLLIAICLERFRANYLDA